jgi:S1-C subfamily serine protease
MKRAIAFGMIIISITANAEKKANLPERPITLSFEKLKSINKIERIDINTNSIFATKDIPLDNVFKLAKNAHTELGSKSRSSKDSSLFKKIAPSVVLIVTKNGEGTGSLISDDGVILTNHHVIEGYTEVAILFKPKGDLDTLSKSDLRFGKVIKVDEISDLALVKVQNVPKERVPIKLGDASDISVGIDVHAIGHPESEVWSYTKGIISQYRKNYKWTSGKNTHVSNVIQMQTPLNFGNSGGPLLNDDGFLIGVNSFKKTNSEGLNYSVSIDQVKNFIAADKSKFFQKNKGHTKLKCEPRIISKAYSKKHSGKVLGVDIYCNGKTNAYILEPENKSEPIVLYIDRNKDDKSDIIFFDYNRDKSYDLSLWDINFDNNWDKVGLLKDGELEPYQFVDYEEYLSKVENVSQENKND